MHIRAYMVRICAYMGIYGAYTGLYVHIWCVYGHIWVEYGHTCAYMVRIRSCDPKPETLDRRRYPAYWEGSELLRDEVEAGRLRISQYCKCRSGGGTWRFDGCIL